MPLRDILVIPETAFSRQLRNAVRVLDRIHAFPSCAPFPVIITRSRSADGAYNFMPRSGRPISIEISGAAPFPALTLIHEVGHMLDHLALNPIKRGFGSELDPMFEPLWVLWDASRLVKSWRALHARMPKQLTKQRRFIAYQWKLPELWTLTYQQWVVTRADDLALQTEFWAARAQAPSFGGVACDFCWDEAEFEGIMIAVNKIFHEAGLL